MSQTGYCYIVPTKSSSTASSGPKLSVEEKSITFHPSVLSKPHIPIRNLYCDTCQSQSRAILLHECDADVYLLLTYQCLCCDSIIYNKKPLKKMFPESLKFDFENFKKLKKDKFFGLVGIELNPGPPKMTKAERKIARKARKLLNRQQAPITAVVPLASIPRRRGNRSRNLQRRGRFQEAEVAYMGTIIDPWKFPGVRSGFGTMARTELVEGFTKGVMAVANNQDGFIAILNPDACAGGLGTTTALLNNWLTLSTYVGNTGTVQTALVPTNYNNIITSMATNRTVSGGLKIKISHAETAQPGDIGFIRLNGLTGLNQLDVLNINPSVLMSYPQAETFTTVGGSANIQINWLPSDPSDYSFATRNIYSNGNNVFNPIVIFGSGFPPGAWKIYYDAVTHLEVQTGLTLQSAEPIIEGAGLDTTGTLVADIHATPESSWRKFKSVVSDVSEMVSYSIGAAREVSDLINDWKPNKNPRRANRRTINSNPMLLIEEMKE